MWWLASPRFLHITTRPILSMPEHPAVSSTAMDIPIVVADNASTDDSVAVVAKDFPGVRLIRLDRNYGFADGYNRALEQVDAEYFLLLNSDVEVTEGWLEPLLSFMEGNPNAVACQPKILAYNNKTHFEYAGASGGFIDRYGYPYCRGRLFDSVEEDKGQYDSPCRVFWATGAAMMVRSAAFRKVGGLDGSFFAHMEEIDLCWRLLARGGEIYAVPQSRVYHVGGATLNRSNPRKTFLNFRNNLLMLYKNLPHDELRSVMRIRAVLDYVAAFKFLLTGAFGDFKAVLHARREYKRMRDEYKPVREQNLAAATVPVIEERARFSLLWQYYVKGKKHFSQLK
ncbi:MAG: glycosyltransferase family 2 protein [Bacteroidaceae bacterium]|nr:glycosyltransferase family 2 protein [Bacteroidaceae bacterium]